MIKQTITYTDFNDEEVTEDFYFNFTLLEIVEQIEVNKLEEKMSLLTKTNDGPGAYRIFKGIVLDAYGHKTPDGRQFKKNPDIRAEFESSPAISEMIISFLQDEALGVAFLSGLLPKDKMEQALAKAEAKKSGTAGIQPAQPVPTAQNVAQIPTGYMPQDATAAAETERTGPLTPVPTDTPMTTADKRQYTNEELEAIAGVPGGVPSSPETQVTDIEGEPSDEQVLAMNPQELAQKGLLMRAYQLKSQQA